MTSIRTTPESLIALGQLVPGAKGQLSPYNVQHDSALREEDRVLLETESEVLALLARPQSVTRVQLAGSAAVFEYSVYFGHDGRAVSLKTVSGEVVIDEPAPTVDVLEYLSNMVGSSVIVGAEFGCTLSAIDAIVFAAVVDHERKRQLFALATGQVSDEPPDVAWIERHLDEPSGAFVRLSAAVSRVVGPALPSASQIADSLASVDRESARALASHLLNVEMVMTILVLSENADGTLSRVELTCPIAGLHGVLSIDRVAHNVRLETISTSGLLRLANFYLTEPNALASPDRTAASIT